VFEVGWDDVRDAFVDESDKVDFNLQYAGDTVGISAIVFGTFMTLLSAMGCIGGCCRVRFLLAIYAIIVMILLIGQIVVVGLVAANGSDAEDKINEGLRDSLKGFNETLKDDRSKAWASVFSTFECCGVEGNWSAEFKNNGFIENPNRDASEKNLPDPIPIACCKDFDYEANVQTVGVFSQTDIKQCLVQKDPTKTYTTGCETKVKDAISDNKAIVIGVGVAIFIIEIMVVVIAFFLCCRDNDD
jgi:hypothetical protein